MKITNKAGNTGFIDFMVDKIFFNRVYSNISFAVFLLFYTIVGITSAVGFETPAIGILMLITLVGYLIMAGIPAMDSAYANDSYNDHRELNLKDLIRSVFYMMAAFIILAIIYANNKPIPKQAKVYEEISVEITKVLEYDIHKVEDTYRIEYYAKDKLMFTDEYKNSSDRELVMLNIVSEGKIVKKILFKQNKQGVKAIHILNSTNE
jgi:hypothetical protein